MRKPFFLTYTLYFALSVFTKIMAYLLIIVSSFTSLIEGMSIKLYNKKNQKGGFVFTSFISFFAMCFFLIKYLVINGFGKAFPSEIIIYSVIGGLLYACASFCTFLAFSIGSLAISNLVLSYNIIITSLFGIIFLSEECGALKIIGFVLLVIALFFLRGERKKENGTEKNNKFLWVIFITLSVIFSAGFSIITRLQQIKFNDTVSDEYYIITLLIASLGLFFTGVFYEKKETKNIIKKCFVYAGIGGLGNGITNSLGLVITMLMELSIYLPTRTVFNSIVAFCISYFALKEKFLKRQIIGLIIGCVAVLLINF